MVSGPTIIERIASFPKEIEKELIVTQNYKPVAKDILIVTYNQFDCLKNCIQSIRDNTEGEYNIYVWHNGGNKETNNWLQFQSDIRLTQSQSNVGFIISNNHLIAQGDSPYVILLNDDTIVHPDWDKAMIAHLQQNKKVDQVGYIGGFLDENAKGCRFGWGKKVDYIPGWCFAISRETYQEFGLFDEAFKFAYCEDADLSLRLTAAKRSIYALHLGLVDHLENQTIKNLPDDFNNRTTFEGNHELLKKRWKAGFFAKS